MRTIDSLSSQSKQIPSFSRSAKIDNRQSEGKTLVAFIHHRTAILCRRGNSSPQISFCSKLKKRGSSREEDLGGQAFRPRSPRSKWLFRGQESRRCRRELKIRAIGHEGEGLVEEEEAELRFYPRAPVVVVVVVPPQLGWNFADIPLPLFRPLFSSSLLSLSLLLFATHATLVGSLDPCPFEGRGFPLFPFSAATVTSTLSISPKADANEHMEVTWKYDVDVARRENGKGDDGLVKKAVTVTWI